MFSTLRQTFGDGDRLLSVEIAPPFDEDRTSMRTACERCRAQKCVSGENGCMLCVAKNRKCEYLVISRPQRRTSSVGSGGSKSRNDDDDDDNDDDNNNTVVNQQKQAHQARRHKLRSRAQSVRQSSPLSTHLASPKDQSRVETTPQPSLQDNNTKSISTGPDMGLEDAQQLFLDTLFPDSLGQMPSVFPQFDPDFFANMADPTPTAVSKSRAGYSGVGVTVEALTAQGDSSKQSNHTSVYSSSSVDSLFEYGIDPMDFLMDESRVSTTMAPSGANDTNRVTTEARPTTTHSSTPSDSVATTTSSSSSCCCMMTAVSIYETMQAQLVWGDPIAGPSTGGSGGPTVEAIAATVARLASERRVTTTNGTTNSSSTEQQQQDPLEAKIRALMNRHKALLSSKLGPMDLFGGNMYEGINVFIPLRPGVSFGQAYKVLQRGLVRAMEIVPTLAGKVIPCSEHEIGYKKGDVRISLPPLQSTALGTTPVEEPRQLRFRDLSSVVPSYAEQRASGFMTSAYPDELLTDCPSFPDLPTDVLNVQANFVDGGCVLAFNVHHHAFDGIGMLIALTVWAECCRFIQGDQSATSEWLHPESLNRDMLSILYELEGFAKPASEVDPRVWGFLPYADPALKRKHEEKEEDTDMTEAAAVNGNVTEPDVKRARLSRQLPEPPVLPACEHWPPAPRADGRTLTASTFVISAQKLESLQKTVEVAEAADPESQSLSKESGSLSLGDVLQAFFWRAAVRARRCPEDSTSDGMSIIEMPTDVRHFFSSHLPPTYMANCVVMNRQHMSVAELCSSQTSLYKIAQICREARTRIHQELVHDAFSLLHTIEDNSPGNHTTGFLSQGIQDGPHSLFNNLMLFQASDIGPFGGDIFEAPEAVRVQMDWLNKAFRSLFILPMRKDGGVELLLGTLPEELDAMKNDGEFMQFAEFLG
ncbi:nonribosomal peptide synthetase MxcG (component of the myxochelin iron transport regulon) [Fusarium bulbicola]|nr:nonribosomal peptide synthetase MxcG (component of the myxochelin iron transport regulon) [Fusarium bulbicola]